MSVGVEIGAVIQIVLIDIHQLNFKCVSEGNDKIV
jgi:hypothetical protein